MKKPGLLWGRSRAKSSEPPATPRGGQLRLVALECELSRVRWYAPFTACVQTPGTKHLYPLICLASFLLFCSVFKRFICFILCGCFAYMYIYAPRVCSAHSSQKGVSEPLELELPVTSATCKALCRCWGLTDVAIHPGLRPMTFLPHPPECWDHR